MQHDRRTSAPATSQQVSEGRAQQHVASVAQVQGLVRVRGAERQADPPVGERRVRHVAESVLGDENLADQLGDPFDGQIEIDVRRYDDARAHPRCGRERRQRRHPQVGSDAADPTRGEHLDRQHRRVPVRRDAVLPHQGVDVIGDSPEDRGRPPGRPVEGSPDRAGGRWRRRVRHHSVHLTGLEPASSGPQSRRFCHLSSAAVVTRSTWGRPWKVASARPIAVLDRLLRLGSPIKLQVLEKM